MAARKPKEIPGDDGRTIVDMNVDGMPWYVPKRKADAEAEGENPYQMTKDELRAVLGHEISHVANGDMVTMCLAQGVLNVFVIFILLSIPFTLTITFNKPFFISLKN